WSAAAAGDLFRRRGLPQRQVFRQLGHRRLECGREAATRRDCRYTGPDSASLATPEIGGRNRGVSRSAAGAASVDGDGWTGTEPPAGVATIIVDWLGSPRKRLFRGGVFHRALPAT